MRWDCEWQTHAGIITSKEAEMVAFCDLIVERAVEAKTAFGTEDAQVFSDYKEMLAEAELDVVHVCTPNASHAELSIAALEADCHVMCENQWQNDRRSKSNDRCR